MLRLVKPEAITDDGVLNRYRKLLSDDERARIERLKFDRDRHIRLVAQASLRLFLAETTGVTAEGLTFLYSSHGKPFLREPEGVTFNLSHTDGMIAMIAERGLHDVGIDVESMDRKVEPHELAAHFFAAPEIEDLGRFAGEAARLRFFQYWTLKESYVKARGEGLSIPLDQFWFVLSDGHRPAEIRFAAGFAEQDPAAWRFSQYLLPSRHVVATATGEPAV